MNAAVERALLLLLYRAKGPEELEWEQLLPDDDRAELDDLSDADAIAYLRAALRSDEGPLDTVVAVQGIVLGLQLGAEAATEVDALASDLLASVGLDDEGRVPLLVAAARGLRTNIAAEVEGEDDRVERTDEIVNEVLPSLEAALQPLVKARRSQVARNHLRFTGPAAALAAMLVEATVVHSTRCRVDFPPDPSTNKGLTFVRLDLCTSLPWDVCRQRIDPIHWPDCNPYFTYVHVLRRTDVADGWYGAICEKVGPALNGHYYTTNLKVRFVQRPQLIATAFDLLQSPQVQGDGLVTVDQGFLAVIDEGTHRRIQMLKVYRIEDLDTRHSWVCPLWLSQMMLSGWSCAATVPMRRALKAWSQVMHDVVDIGRNACDALHCDCPDHDHAARRSKVAPLSYEHYEVPLPSACVSSFTDQTGEACVPVPPNRMGGLFPPPQVEQAALEQSYLPTHDTVVTPDLPDSAMEVRLRMRSRGLFLGRLRDAPSTCDVPFTVYDTGLPNPGP